MIIFHYTFNIINILAMNLSKIYYCRECRPSHHLLIKNAKNAILENPRNMPAHTGDLGMAVMKDYVFKNVIKKPEDFGHIGRIASETSKVWKKARVLNIAFLHGDKDVINRVIRHAKEWMEYANIELNFKPGKKPTDVRITFDKNDGSWSYVGTEILSIAQKDPTMNLGWLTPSTDDLEYRRVVLHEFGHTLACIHEHERPDAGIPWNKPKVYEYYKEADGWSKEEVDAQVFDQYDASLIRGTKIDRHSIMMYPVPADLTTGGYTVGWNNSLSELDKKYIAKLYKK
jgi:hypothetical protein